MAQFHQAIARGECLPKQTQQELENLAEQELMASIERAAIIIEKTQQSSQGESPLSLS
jgi:hypothetical protein